MDNGRVNMGEECLAKLLRGSRWRASAGHRATATSHVRNAAHCTKPGGGSGSVHPRKSWTAWAPNHLPPKDGLPSMRRCGQTWPLTRGRMAIRTASRFAARCSPRVSPFSGDREFYACSRSPRKSARGCMSQAPPPPPTHGGISFATFRSDVLGIHWCRCPSATPGR
jgi:hypothetical protein